jgi:hypothetical protein
LDDYFCKIKPILHFLDDGKNKHEQTKDLPLVGIGRFDVIVGLANFSLIRTRFDQKINFCSLV